MSRTDTCDLAKRECLSCKGVVEALKGGAIEELFSQLCDEWRVRDEHHLERVFTFKNFREALDFTNLIGELAESQGHHPDILLSWGKVFVTLCTHKINGLSESDFILAAKIDRL